MQILFALLNLWLLLVMFEVGLCKISLFCLFFFLKSRITLSPARTLFNQDISASSHAHTEYSMCIIEEILYHMGQYHEDPFDNKYENNKKRGYMGDTLFSIEKSSVRDDVL